MVTRHALGTVANGLGRFMLPKEEKTQSELERIITERCDTAGIRIASVTVSASRVSGWEANFMAAPALIQGYLPQFEAIVRELRARYDLK
jgi:hypothetical protein